MDNQKKIIHKKTVLERNLIRKALVYSTIEGSFAAMMISFGSSFVSAFAIKALHSNALKNSIIVYIPPFLLAISQIFSGWISDKIGKRKIIVLICVFFQSISWFFLFWISYLTKSTVLLITIFTLNTVIGYFGNTPWISWLGSIVPSRRRGKYFGLRERIINVISFISSISAGLILYYISKTNVFLAFGIIFHLAGLWRFLSFIFLAKQYEPEYTPPKRIESPVSIKTFIKNKNFVKFSIFNSIFMFFIAFASPLFLIYILRMLKYSYFQFTILNLAVTFSIITFSTFWGKISDKYGSLYAFKAGIIPTFLITLLWLLSGNFYVLIISMLLSGFCWSGIRISSRNVFYDNIKEQQRNRVYGISTVFSSGGAVLGAILGGIAVDNWVSLKSAVLLSTIFRFILPVFLFFNLIKENVKTQAVPNLLKLYFFKIFSFLSAEIKMLKNKIIKNN